jgi:serine/threonine protein kinase
MGGPMDDVAGLLDELRQRFPTLEPLGEGGMGAVYRAADPASGEPRAIKVLTGRQDDGRIARFKREFRAAARLSHPNCLRVFEFGQAGSRLYFTMEYLEGGTLEVGKQQTPQATAAIGLQLLAALDHLHAKKIVHRDVKPANILVVRQGEEPLRVKLADFGIGKPLEQSEDADVGYYVGSLKYLAPEQLDRGQADARSDLYSTGVVLYMLLTGRHPTVSDAKSGRWAAEDRPVHLLDLEEGRGLPRPFTDCIMQLLATDPRARPSSAAEAFDLLASGLAQNPPPWQLPVLPPLERRPLLGAPAFVGREKEQIELLGFLQHAFEHDARSPRRVFSLRAPAGTGKSRLLNQTVKDAEAAGTRLFLGTCLAEGGKPYLPLRSLIRASQLESPGSEEKTHTGVGSLVANAPVRATDTRTATVDPPKALGVEADRVEGEGQRWRFQRQVADFLLTVSRDRPSLVVIEDAQWADGATLELLSFIVKSLQGAAQGGAGVRVAIILTYRPEPHPPALAALLSQADDGGIMGGLELEPLGEVDVTGLVASMLMQPEDDAVRSFAKDLTQITRGNPLFTAELLYTLLAQGRLTRADGAWTLGPELLSGTHVPASTRDAVGDRAARLWVGAKRVLEVASVVGKAFDLPALQATAALEPEQVLDALDEAIRAGFIDESATVAGYAFAHDRYREAFYERLGAEDLSRIHLTLAEDLERRFDNVPDRAGELAHHYRKGGRREKACTFAARAGRSAIAQSAFASAALFFEEALDDAMATGQPRPPELVELLGDACLPVGRYDVAAEAFSERLEQVAEDGEVRANLLSKLGAVEVKRGNVTQARRLCEASLRALGKWVPPNAPLVVGSLLWEVAVQLFHALVPRWFQARRPADDPRLRRELLAAQLMKNLGIAYRFDGSVILPALAWTFIRNMNTLECYAPTPALAEAWAVFGLVMVMPGFHKLVAHYGERGLQLARAFGNQQVLGMSSMGYGIALYIGGHFERSRDLHRESLIFNQNHPDMWQFHESWNYFVWATFRLGGVGEAKAQLPEFYASARRIGDEHGVQAALDLWAKITWGNLPAHLRAELAKDEKDIQNAICAAQAEGLCLLRERAWAEASLTFARADELAKRAGRNSEPDALAASPIWRAMALRLEALNLEKPPHEKTRLFKAAQRCAREGLRRSRSHPNSKPFALRELGLLAVLLGRDAEAKRMLEESVATARAQRAQWDWAHSLWELGRLGQERGWPQAESQLSDARRALSEMGSDYAELFAP